MESHHGLDRWDVVMIIGAVLICTLCLAVFLAMAALEGRL